MIKEKKLKDLLDELQGIVNSLKVKLPKEAPLFISSSIDPLRILFLREACFHRITELSESACDAFKKENLITGYVLAQAVMEVSALFLYLISAVQGALRDGDVEALKEILIRMFVGINSKKKLDSFEEIDGARIFERVQNPISVSVLMKYVTENLSSFKDLYDCFNEVAQPNTMNFIKAYVRGDRSKKMTYFGKEQGKLGGHLESDIQVLISCLEDFMDIYNQFARLVVSFQGSAGLI